MIDVEDFVVTGPTPSRVVSDEPPKKAQRYSHVSWTTINAIEKAGPRHSAKFWALVILLGVRRELVLTYSRLREVDGWVRVSTSLLPGNKKLPAPVKREAVTLLERAGLVEVRRAPHASPRVRLVRKKGDT